MPKILCPRPLDLLIERARKLFTFSLKVEERSFAVTFSQRMDYDFSHGNFSRIRARDSSTEMPRTVPSSNSRARRSHSVRNAGESVSLSKELCRVSTRTARWFAGN